MLEIVSEKLSRQQMSELERFGRRVNQLDCNFALCDDQGRILLITENQTPTDWEKVVKDFRGNMQKYLNAPDQIFELDGSYFLVSVLCYNSGKPQIIAFVDLCFEPESKADVNIEILKEMLFLLSGKFQTQVNQEKHTEVFSKELTQIYEELALMYKLGSNMKVSNSDSNYLQLACDSLKGIVNLEGIVILLEKEIYNERRMLLTAGSGLIDFNEDTINMIHSRLLVELSEDREALLDSSIGQPYKYKWPENIKSIIAVPLFGKDRKQRGLSVETDGQNSVIGVMAAINRMDKPDFDSADLKLFNSVVNGCAVFVENGRLFSDIKELFLGSLKALSSSIDAKDKYTRGHSERVAFISQWIAERCAEKMKIDKDVINNIYLCGLLHDVGKIGIPEAVLCKNGKLTSEEYECIKKHPVIGASIINEIKQMHNILPGILYHHERYDGKGYPNGLAGDEIPLLGKIVGLADSFDAMTTKRIYRKALTLEAALKEIEDGLGTQFDPQIGRIFLDSDVYYLWKIIQEGFAKSNKPSLIDAYDTTKFEDSEQ